MSRTIRAEGMFLALLLLVPACAERRVVETEMSSLEAAYDAIRADAASIAPDRANAIELAIAQARENLEEGDLRESSATVRDLVPQVKELADRLPGMRVELESAWKRLRTSLPGAIASLGQDLRRAHRPPAGRNRAAFDEANDELSALEEQWQEAQSAREDGRLAEAVNRGESVKISLANLATRFHRGS